MQKHRLTKDGTIQKEIRYSCLAGQWDSQILTLIFDRIYYGQSGYPVHTLKKKKWPYRNFDTAYHLYVHAEGDGGEEAEHDARQDQVVAARMRVHDYPKYV